MSKKPVTISKKVALKPVEDYYRLRREGIGFIEQLGSSDWTDYNTHDPGITILEALCYALTDLGYRTSWKIEDILASAGPDVYANQPFFTARDILTVNPWTPDDFRRLLIDLDGVRNAWIFCKECACDLVYYAWCENDSLQLAYEKPAKPYLTPKKVEVLGLYDVMLELESDPESGDLNDRKIEHHFSIFDTQGKPHTAILELRFPAWELSEQQEWELFLNSDAAFADPDANLNLTIPTFNASPDEAGMMTDQDLQRHWRKVLYLDLDLEILPGGDHIVISNAALRIFGDTTVRENITVADLLSLFADKSPSGFLQRYRTKLKKTAVAVVEAKKSLHAHRNLDEDFCRILPVSIEEVAVCADVEVTPDADIELVQAKIWFEIEQYFNPPIRFYTLKELMDAGMPVEDIFNGPALNSGFIKQEELEEAGLKTFLHTSDILNRLMDIEGVVAVNNLLLTKYDAVGNPVKGAADPVVQNGTLVYDPDKVSAFWTLAVSGQHQPRLYFNLSRFLFSKNGLPFLPRMDEAEDTLEQLRGAAERPKIKNAANDLPVPKGIFRDPENYFAMQHSLPLTYGAGPAGLPSHASVARRAQARQLKAYLLVFEQYLVNALAQVTHTANLFSLDAAEVHTYFSKVLDNSIVARSEELLIAGYDTALQEMVETDMEFLLRRNRFLDHIMARFGEQFSEYALLLNNLSGKAVALKQLISDKLGFLNAYPVISRDRAKAFNYTEMPCAPENYPGIKRRVSLLLGYPDLFFSWTITGPAFDHYSVDYQLLDSSGNIWLQGNLTVVTWEPDQVTALAYHAIVIQMVQQDAYVIEVQNVSGVDQHRVKLLNADATDLGQHPDWLATLAEAQALVEELAAWSANHRAMVVEHLLLRPKFAGDALFPACTEGGCHTCGDEDPYSFRLTFVMPGWVPPFDQDLDMRGFADRTIRQETPSHLLPKVCWVDNRGFLFDSCHDPILDDLAKLLQDDQATAYTEEEACLCAQEIFQAYAAVFEPWFSALKTEHWLLAAWKTKLEALFAGFAQSDLTCTAPLDANTWVAIGTMLVDYFADIALYGWQFEKFEAAWCAWLDANAKFDWTDERLQERVEAILEAGLLSSGNNLAPGQLCTCAAAILAAYGTKFYQWMKTGLDAGKSLSELGDIPDTAGITLCAGLSFKPETAAEIEALLRERYTAYTEVSYRLWILTDLLSKLENIYPGATLHDCDDGSDDNPVRLGQTALGTYARQQLQAKIVTNRSVAAPPRQPVIRRLKPARQKSAGAAKGKLTLQDKAGNGPVSETPVKPTKPVSKTKTRSKTKDTKAAKTVAGSTAKEKTPMSATKTPPGKKTAKPVADSTSKRKPAGKRRSEKPPVAEKPSKTAEKAGKSTGPKAVRKARPPRKPKNPKPPKSK